MGGSRQALSDGKAAESRSREASNAVGRVTTSGHSRRIPPEQQYRRGVRAPPYNAGPVTTISNGVAQPQQTLVDPTGNLFVLNAGALVTEFAPPYTGAPTGIGRIGGFPTVLAMDADAKLSIGYGDNSTVSVYAKPYTGAPIATASTGINNPVALAIERLVTAAGDDWAPGRKASHRP